MKVEPFTPVTREEAAKRLSVSLSTIDNLISSGALPPPKTLGGRKQYWHPDVFYGWLDQQLRGETPTSPTTVAPPPEPAMPIQRSKRPRAQPYDAVHAARAREAARLAELNK